MRDTQAFSPIRVLRAARGAAQHDLAEAVGVSTSAISNLEAGRWAAPPDVLKRVAAALNAPVGAVTGGGFVLTATDDGKVEVSAAS